MPTENDVAWDRYLAAKNIRFDLPSYLIDAAELKYLAQREPRLLAKFDRPDQLPRRFREAGYTLLPVRNGQYQLVRGNLFVAVDPCASRIDFVPTLPFPLLTSGRGSSEAQFIDYAFNTRLLHHFLNVDEMYLTIRGREYSRQFSFTLANVNLHVESVQIEVDAGYGTFTSIILLKAKIGLVSHFNVRQMYYPFRHFSSLIPQKQIRNIFLCYDIPTASYHVYEYLFPKLEDPLSINQNRCATYKIAPPQHFTIFDLLDTRFQTQSTVVPQADDLNKLIEFLTLIQSVKTPTNTPRYSGATIRRRRRTIVAWIRWLAQEMGCFSVVGDGMYYLI